MHKRLQYLHGLLALHFGLLLAAHRVSAEAPENVALRLDGIHGPVELPSNLLTGLEEATFEGWFRWDRFGYFSQPLAFGEEWRSAGINLFSARSEVQFYMYADGGSVKVIRASGAVKLGEWVHLAAVFGRCGMKLYVDGVFAGGNACTNMPKGERNWLGKAVWKDNEPFVGQLDELRLWRRQRTADEINQSRLRRMAGSEEGLVALWNFDGRNLKDLTSGGIDGTNSGSLRWSEAGPSWQQKATQPAIISGIVFSPAGLPVPSAMVDLRHDNALIDRIHTDPAGSFTFAVRGGSGYTVDATHGETGIRSDEFAVAPAERRELALTARPAKSISGVVRARDGSPQALAVVQVVARKPDGSLVCERMVRAQGGGPSSL